MVGQELADELRRGVVEHHDDLQQARQLLVPGMADPNIAHIEVRSIVDSKMIRHQGPRANIIWTRHHPVNTCSTTHGQHIT
jgi:hypothetical protein